MDITEIKERLLMDIEGTASWRAEKAIEYPEDAERNLSAQSALNELWDHINDLPVTHALFSTEEQLIEKKDGMLEAAIEEKNINIRTYGFQAEADPQGFVDKTIELYRYHMKD